MSNLGRYQGIIEESYRAGGPDMWINTIKSSAYKDGVLGTIKIMIPISIACVGLGAIGTKAFEWVSKTIKERNKIKKEADIAEQLIKKENPELYEIKEP